MSPILQGVKLTPFPWLKRLKGHAIMKSNPRFVFLAKSRGKIKLVPLHEG